MGDDAYFHVSVVPWPVGSSNLMVLVFFLWVCLKECLYRNRPITTHELVCVIRVGIAKVNQKLLARVFESCVKPLRLCAANEGGNLQDVIDLSI